MNNIQIIIGHRGWVWVGRVSRDGSDVIIDRARCIRRWGTKGKGLAYLAAHGPQEETILDAPAQLVVHELAIVGRHPCDEAAWGAVVDAD